MFARYRYAANLVPRGGKSDAPTSCNHDAASR
jgi:hypothetical protein